jgi:hypothetical protein
MPGLAPGIHDQARHKKSNVNLPPPIDFMDCRVKPGNDKKKRNEQF